MLKQIGVWFLLFITGIVVINAATWLQEDDLYKFGQDLPEIFHLIDRAYVDEVDLKQLMPSAFQGALSRVDENASYIPPGIQPVDLNQKIFETTGLSLTKRNGYAYILSVAEGSAAMAAGLAPDAYIKKIGASSTFDLSLYHIKTALAAGFEDLTLTWVTDNSLEEQVAQLKPGKTPVSTMVHTAHEGGLHVFKIPQFYGTLEQDLKKELAGIQDTNEKLVLDLRSNVNFSNKNLMLLASLFLPAGKLAAWVGTQNREVPLVNPSAGPYAGRPIFVLVDRSTSGVAEAFGAVAQESESATLIGQATLGQIRRYQFIPLKSGGHLEIPTKVFRLNSGRDLSGNGVKPDLEIEADDVPLKPEVLLSRALNKVRESQLKKAS